MKLKEGRYRLGLRKKVFCNGGGKTLEQVSLRSCGYPSIELLQDQVGKGFEQ